MNNPTRKASKRLLTIALLISSATAMAANINFEENLKLGEQRLERCNSTDIKALMFVDVGDAALYLNDCTQADTSEFLLAIRYDRAFTASDFQSSSEVLIQRNNEIATYQAIKPEMDAFNQHYQGVNAGDEYQISFTKARGLELRKNQKLVSHSSSSRLAKAYFNVWFGDKPFNKNMKKNLLKGL